MVKSGIIIGKIHSQGIFKGTFRKKTYRITRLYYANYMP